MYIFSFLKLYKLFLKFLDNSWIQPVRNWAWFNNLSQWKMTFDTVHTLKQYNFSTIPGFQASQSEQDLSVSHRPSWLNSDHLVMARSRDYQRLNLEHRSLVSNHLDGRGLPSYWIVLRWRGRLGRACLLWSETWQGYGFKLFVSWGKSMMQHHCQEHTACIIFLGVPGIIKWYNLTYVQKKTDILLISYLSGCWFIWCDWRTMYPEQDFHFKTTKKLDKYGKVMDLKIYKEWFYEIWKKELMTEENTLWGRSKYSRTVGQWRKFCLINRDIL